MSFTLRQWHTDTGEPEPEPSVRHTPVVHREPHGPWTFEIRSDIPLSPIDCGRIIAFIVSPEGSGEDSDNSTADAAVRASAELTEALGTGRSLDDYLEEDASLLIRTDFGDDDAWRVVAALSMAPGVGEDAEFVATLTCIDNPENDGLSIDALLDKIGDRPTYYAFLADTVTLTEPEHPILAVDTGPEETGHERGRTVRVLPSEMAAIENNLSIANMDFAEFADAAGPDGVFRGFI
ncbi:DUF6924 domain-containing protein [Nocardia jinanensis]|uniref:DUF6924 domain-containing protein n=1 Tax=Nocardia jinanensis TaxID=382504 RepID=A0A917VVN8_9NOCA|nr:hypothetical protein [Nocardia jinanensis]GGL18532.1 hypothetical protein GCM10011588_36440 [Nocardia jinanensis]